MAGVQGARESTVGANGVAETGGWIMQRMQRGARGLSEVTFGLSPKSCRSKKREGKVQSQVPPWELRQRESERTKGHRDRKRAQEEDWIINSKRWLLEALCWGVMQSSVS